MTAPTPTTVEVRRTATDDVLPIRFTWEGEILDITDYGRRWSDEEGDHWLVMADRPERAFTLHRSTANRWTVSASKRPRTVV
jgi:hypothetical protein